MRAITYARVSGDDSHKEGRNLQSQLEMCRQFCQEKEYTIVSELAEDDRGASGASWDLPQLNRALDMARNGEFDVLVTRELDRFARSLAKQLVIEVEFKRHGVEIQYVLAEYEDTPEGRLNKHIRAVVAEYEREQINRRMTRGRMNIVRNGKVMLHGNKPPYGYRVEDRMLTVYESEAETVKNVFTWYVYGDEDGKKLSIRAIAKKLTKARIPTYADLHVNKPKKRGYGEWSPSVVAQLLSNETYAGTWCYGSDKLAVDVPVIVDRETWERAQKRKVHNGKMSRRNTKHKYLFSKRVTCQCETKMTGRAVTTRGKLYLYYICPASRGQLASVECSARSFRADQVDEMVWDWITNDLFSDPQRLADSVNTYLENETAAKQKVIDRVEIAEGLLVENRQKMSRLLDFYIENPSLSKEWLIDKQKALETTIWSLEQELSQLHSTLIHWQTLREYYEEELGGDAEHWQSFLTKMVVGAKNKEETIEKLDVQVRLFTDNGQQKAHIRCTLGESVLSLTSLSSRSPC